MVGKVLLKEKNKQVPQGYLLQANCIKFLYENILCCYIIFLFAFFMQAKAEQYF